MNIIKNLNIYYTKVFNYVDCTLDNLHLTVIVIDKGKYYIPNMSI